MKKSILILVIIFFSFFSFCENAKKITVEIPRGNSSIHSTFYCFNELETGRKLAKEIYRVNDLDKILRAGRFKKLMMIPPGSEITAYNYSIMTFDHEFWFFENRDDGWLWGTGRY